MLHGDAVPRDATLDLVGVEHSCRMAGRCANGRRPAESRRQLRLSRGRATQQAGSLGGDGPEGAGCSSPECCGVCTPDIPLPAGVAVVRRRGPRTR
jgi:hypothetical protein